MERHKAFLGQNTYFYHQVDQIMDAIARNSQEFGAFLTTEYGINLQEDSDALLVEVIAGPDYIVNPGKALSPEYNLIINDANKSFDTELQAAFDPYPPDNGTKAYIYITTKETADTGTTVTFHPGYTDSNPYETWTIDCEIKVCTSESAPDDDAILLAEMTYNSGWTVTADRRSETQFAISSGLAVIIDHLLSAHTACIYPDDSGALDPSKSGDTTMVFASMSGAYVYSDGHIYTSISSYSYDFLVDPPAQGWYYIYIEDQDLALKYAGNSFGDRESLTEAGLDDDQYLVLCYVWWNGTDTLTWDDAYDMRSNYYLATRADQIRFTPSGALTVTNVQDAVEDLESEKIYRDGTIAMTGDLNIGYFDIINVQDINLSPQMSDHVKHLVQTASNDLHLNTQGLASNDKGIRLSYSGDVYIQGIVKANIRMGDGYTVDGVDLSEITITATYDYVVDRNGDEGVGSGGTVGLDYALEECGVTAGSIFIKTNKDSENYAISDVYSLQNGCTIVGENPDDITIEIPSGDSIDFGDYFNVENLHFKFMADSSTLTFGDDGVLRNCWNEVDSGVIASITLGASRYFDFNSPSVDDAVDAVIDGATIVGCMFYIITVDSGGDNDSEFYTTIDQGTFHQVRLYGYYSRFSNCSTPSEEEYEIVDSTDTGGNSTTLADSVENFTTLGVKRGDVVYNDTESLVAYVISKDSDHQLTTGDLSTLDDWTGWVNGSWNGDDYRIFRGGWVIPDFTKAMADETVAFPSQYIHMSNCSGSILNCSDASASGIANNDKPHYMVVCHRGGWIADPLGSGDIDTATGYEVIFGACYEPAYVSGSWTWREWTISYP